MTPLYDFLQSQVEGETEVVKTSRKPHHLTYRVEDFIQQAAYAHFLETGTLIPLKKLPKGVSDEEYLGGIMAFCNYDIQRYVVGRAIERDTSSVEICKGLVGEMFEKFSEFDFRNGPIRRKFDGIKYAVRKCENVLYELAVTERTKVEEAVEPAAKKQKSDPEAAASGEASFLDMSELAAIKTRYEGYDATRELVIKKCREIQKAAKNSIFAMHRGDLKKAKSLIETCETVGNEILVTIKDEPTLRQGSFSNSLEEYAEALLFWTWLDNGTVMTFDDFKKIEINEEEYLGGICDLSGEVGRVAVVYGTKRDQEGVQKCLDTNLSILIGLEGLYLPGKLSKKMDPLKQSVQKLETVLYELSLIQSKGGGFVNMSSAEAPKEEE
ncbi:hypothetical protein TrVE_jg12933 [Triparma verrucosa]|uniref:Translin n=1 Tax=Triparma verrucosa TaxID=1606542 RepID=A0A9W7BVG8_9STRA|nr:hypothetical protein TrVE_jg12933 [Triparma verrucosa]